MSKKIKKVEDKPNMKQPEHRYPVFCFKYLQPCSYLKCNDASFFIEFLERMQKLGELGWKEIDKSGRHSFGTEKIPVKQIKPQLKPSILTPDVTELTVFRATGNNLPFLGIRLNDTFQVIYIETQFGDIYNH
ncbi:MAG: hypothetical protein LCH58_01160 [Bacteroidetes bacterium]|jgi:hypothetical protein|uniref:hypothetical protein n=1 Tax=Phnomibacter sp. TaxID=2836217 RepID=UPI002FDCEF76|nr:hypothetical protein [Bacteroidota bacterium]